jgi:hypothetical protein
VYGNSLYDRNGTYLSRDFLEGKEGVFEVDGSAEFFDESGGSTLDRSYRGRTLICRSQEVVFREEGQNQA